MEKPTKGKVENFLLHHSLSHPSNQCNFPCSDKVRIIFRSSVGMWFKIINNLMKETMTETTHTPRKSLCNKGLNLSLVQKSPQKTKICEGICPLAKHVITSY